MSTYFAEPVRARDVQIIRLCQAICHREGCTWAGGVRNSWAEASADREHHLQQHREGIVDA